MIPSNATLAAPSHIAAADLGGEAIILDAEAGRYFGFNEVAARVIQLVGTPQTLAEVEEKLLAEYDVEPDRLRSDLQTFVQHLAAQNLIEVSGAGEG